MKHLTIIFSALLVLSVLIAGPSAAQNEYAKTDAELIQEMRWRMGKEYATALELAVISLAEALGTDKSGKLFDFLSDFENHNKLDSLKTLEGFDRDTLSLTDVQLEAYNNMGIHAVATDKTWNTDGDLDDGGELVVYAGREEWQPSQTGPIYMHGAATKNDISLGGRQINIRLLGLVENGKFKPENYMITRVVTTPLSYTMVEHLPTSTAAGFIAVRAAALVASESTTTETPRLPCDDGYHGAGKQQTRKITNSINGFGEIMEAVDEPPDWRTLSTNCKVDTTKVIKQTDACPNGIGATWYSITEHIRKDPDDPFGTERFLDPETKEIITDTCEASRAVDRDPTYRDEDNVERCSTVYPGATPAWEGDVTYGRQVTVENIHYVDDPSISVENVITPDWEITSETCERNIPNNVRDDRVEDCLPPYLKAGIWRQTRIFRQIYHEIKGGERTLTSSIPGAWRTDSNSCRNVVTTVFPEYKTANGPCNTYILYRRYVTQITTSYQDGRRDFVSRREGGWSVAHSLGKGGRRMLKFGDHGGSYNNNPCGGSSSGGYSGGGDRGGDRGGDAGSDHHGRDGHSGHGENPDGTNGEW